MKELSIPRHGFVCVTTVTLGLIILGCAPAQLGSGEPGPAAEGPGTNGQDWPMLGGSPSRNAVNTVAKNVPIEWSIKDGARKNVKWSVPIGQPAYGGPAIADGKIFIGTSNTNPRNPKVRGDKGILLCFRESDGRFLWQAVHDKLANRDEDYPQQGIASTPAVDGKRVYYVSNRCELVCADTEGDAEKQQVKFIWKIDMIKQLGVSVRWLAIDSPLIVGDMVYVVTGNGIQEDTSVNPPKRSVPAPMAPSLIAVNKNSGEVIWKNNSPGDKIIDGQWSNPAYAEVNGSNQIIFPGGDGWLYGLEAKTGKFIWKFDCNPKSATTYRTGGRGTQGFMIATPVVYHNKVYLGVTQEPENDSPKAGHLWCVDITKKGDLSPVNDNFDPKAAVNKNSGLVWHYGGPSPKGSDRDWLFGHTLGSCTVHDGLVYAADVEGYFYCLDAQTGKKHWEHDFKTGVWGAPYWVDGKVYIGNDDGDLHIFAHGNEKKILGKIEMDEHIRSSPVVANGVLYIKTAGHLYAIGSK